MARKVAVIGLGHFGSHLARELTRRGVEVLAIDDNRDRLDDVKNEVTQTVSLDATDEHAVRSQGLQDFDVVVVGIGDNFEASLLTVVGLQNIGVKRIVVRATSHVHERILRHLGISEVTLPAVEAADRLANSLVFERILDSFDLAPDHTIAEVSPPDRFIGKSLEELRLAQDYGVSVVTIRRREMQKRFLGMGTKEVDVVVGVPTGKTVIERGDVLLVFGAKKKIEEALKG